MKKLYYKHIEIITYILCFIYMLILFSLSGCVTQQQVDQIKTIYDKNKKIVEIEQVKEKPIEIKPEPIKNDLDFVEVWISNKGVKDWKVTSKLKATFKNDLILETTQNWKPKLEVGKMLSGNIWAVVKHEGKWTACHWEWFKDVRIIKKERSVIMEKFSEHARINHQPKPGDTIHLFITGLVRGSVRNVSERSEKVGIVL